MKYPFFHERKPNPTQHRVYSVNRPRSSKRSRGVSEQWSMASSDSSTLVNFPSYSPTSKERRATWSGNDGRPAELDRLAKLETPHTFVIHCYKSPTICAVCRKLFRGLFIPGLQCKDCKFNCHKRCLEKAPRNCIGEKSLHQCGNSTSDDTEGTKTSELLGEEEDAEESGDFPSPTNEPLGHTMSNHISLPRIAVKNASLDSR